MNNVNAFSSSRIKASISQQTTSSLNYMSNSSVDVMDQPIDESRRPLALKVPSHANKDHNDYTTIGNIKVPSVGIGTISWSSTSFWTSQNSALQQVVSESISSNAAFFDTAERYGGNLKTALGLGWGETEKLTKTLLDKTVFDLYSKPTTNSIPDFNPVIATKFTPSPWRTSADSVVEACEQSRQRLGVQKIDLYQLHMPDIVQPLRFMGKATSHDEAYWDGLAECYHRGLVSNVGVSNYGPTMLRRCQEALAKRDVPIASNQIAYSLIGRRNGAQETVDYCQDNGIKVLGYFPFAMGLLTGKYTADNNKPKQAQTSKTALEVNDLSKYLSGDASISPLLITMKRIAEKSGKTIAQVALNYIICKGVIPIPGARTVSQIRDNIGAIGWRLSEEEVAMLELEADQLGVNFEGAGFKRTSEKFVGYGVEKWKLD